MDNHPLENAIFSKPENRKTHVYRPAKSEDRNTFFHYGVPTN
jgi:hypothetical protein